MNTATADPKGTVLVGLDGEMSGTDLTAGHRLIQAGLAVRAEDGIHLFSSLIGWSEPDLTWDSEAQAVHQIERAAVLAAPSPLEVDAAAAAFLHEATGELGGRTLISVGFNVAAFDHPFFRATLPETMRNVSRRAIELNSLCFALDGLRDGSGRVRSWQRWKEDACAWADERLAADGAAGGPHDAGWDAGRALYVLEYLRGHIHAGRA